MKESPLPALGFIGLGIMGSAMAANLLNARASLTVWNRSTEKSLLLRQKGAAVANSPSEVGENSEVVFLCLRDGAAVEETLFGSNGLLQRSNGRVRVIIDCSTISPASARSCAERASATGVQYLDAPVSGGDIGAKNGTLTVMVGGSHEALDEVQPLLKLIAKSVSYVGESGCGQIMKAANQIAVALSVAAMTEAIHFAEAAGVKAENVVEVLRTGAAGSWSFENYAPRLLRGNFEPGFKAQDMLKDLHIAKETAESLGVEIPAASLVTSLYEALCEGHGRILGNHALIQLYRHPAPKS